jgi:nucleoside-diphosphate-sugar epimerase
MDLTPIRDFIHVEDVAEGLIRLAGALRPGLREAVNLSSGKGHSIRTFARAFAEAARGAGRTALPVRQIRPGPLSPTHRLVLDPNKLLHMTGWTPQIALGRGVRLTLREAQSGSLRWGGRP